MDKAGKFIPCFKLESCQNEDCDIRSTGLWKMPDNRYICDSCRKEETTLKQRHNG